MKYRLTIIGFLCIFLLSPVQVDAKALNRGWLALDAKLISIAVKLLPVLNNSYATFGRQLVGEGLDEVSSREIGFGVRVVTFDKPGGYTKLQVVVAVLGYKIIKGYVYILDYPQDIEDAVDSLPLPPPGGRVTEYGARYDFSFSVVEREYQQVVENYLGKQEEVKLPTDLAADYELLMDPLSELDYGTACYWAGTPPPGREAMDHLITKQRYDLIGNVLRGYSPEGRLYALEAILTKGRESQSLLQRNRQTVLRVVNLPTAVNTCYGCFGGRHTAKEVEQITVLLKELGLQ